MTVRYDRAQWRVIADWLAVAAAVALPWSTSVTYILVGAWAVILIPTIDPDDWRDVIKHPAAWLPLALIGFAVLGMTWATGVEWKSRFEGLTSFLKLLAIPLLLVQFRTSPRAHTVLIAFLVSCSALLLVSWIMVVTGMKPITKNATSYGVPVRDYIVQSQEFILCAVGLIYLIYLRLREKHFGFALALAALVALFLINVTLVAPSRTGLVTAPVLLAILVIAHCRWQISVVAVCVITAAAAAAFIASPKIQGRLYAIAIELHEARARQVVTSAGERFDFWTTGIGIVASAPVIGHGTGSVHQSFIRAAAEKGSKKPPTTNPHNQTLTIAIQLGFAGTLLLYAMWLSHALLFRCGGLAGWVGLAVVAQNVIGSLFNNHLFDFTQAWMYIFGVGVAGGMALSQSLGVTRLEAAQATTGGT
jgi:O-antigen ligase